MGKNIAPVKNAPKAAPKWSKASTIPVALPVSFSFMYRFNATGNIEPTSIPIVTVNKKIKILTMANPWVILSNCGKESEISAIIT